MCNHSNTSIIRAEGYYVCAECGEVAGSVLVPSHSRAEPFHYGVSLGSSFKPRNAREWNLWTQDSKFKTRPEEKFFASVLALKSHFQLGEQFISHFMAQFDGRTGKARIFEIVENLVKDRIIIVDLQEIKEFLELKTKINKFSLNKYLVFISYFPPSLQGKALKIFQQKVARFRGSPKTLLACIYYHIVPGIRSRAEVCKKFKVSRIYGI